MVRFRCWRTKTHRTAPIDVGLLANQTALGLIDTFTSATAFADLRDIASATKDREEIQLTVLEHRFC